MLAYRAGVERLEAALGVVRKTLRDGEGSAWSAGHSRLLEALLAHDPAVLPPRSKLLSDVVLGDDSELKAAETTDLDAAGKRRWAADRLARLIDDEMDRLRDHAATLPASTPRIDPTAANLALFDASPEAILARRYEASTERALFRTLKERDCRIWSVKGLFWLTVFGADVRRTDDANCCSQTT